MASAPKKRKIQPGGGCTSVQAARVEKVATSEHVSPVPVTHVGRMDLKVQQAKKFAIAEAQHDHCLGNFRSFDSPFGNYLVPVIPTRADLFR